MVPNACAIYIDAVPEDLDADDTFQLVNVVNVAEIVVERCLIRERKFGWGFPGMKGNIQVHITRASGLLSEARSRNASNISWINPGLLGIQGERD